MRIETSYKVLLGIIIVVAIIGQIKDNIVSKNEIEKCYKENYTFVYKQETLSDNLIKQFLSQLNEYNYSEEKDKKIQMNINLLILFSFQKEKLYYRRIISLKLCK